MVLPVAVYDYAYEQLGISEKFLEARLEKAKIWVMESQRMAQRVRNNENFALVAYTGGGKTVMGEWVTIDTQLRTLFLLPKRRLTKRQQRLFVAMGAKAQTRAILGETSLPERIWTDHDDRIVFATAHVLVNEIRKNPELLLGFGLIIFDEFQHAATVNHPYSKIAKLAHEYKIPRVGLSASPGNSESKVASTLWNCRLDKQYQVVVPMAKQVGSLIYAEEAEVYKIGKQRFIEEDLIGTEIRRSIYNLNYYANKLFGVSLDLDPNKSLNYFQVSRLRDALIKKFPPREGKHENFNLIDQSSSAAFLLSLLREVEVWCHIEKLAKEESFAAILRYYNEKLANNNKAFAKRMAKRGRVADIINVIGDSMHPKLQLMLMLLYSLVLRRNLQVLVFVENIATAKSLHELLGRHGISSGLFFGSKHMRPSEQEAALELLEDRKINCLIATSVGKEGHDFEVDAVLCSGAPKNLIEFIQGSGRAGRHERDAELLYVGTARERRKIRSLDKAAVKLQYAKASQFLAYPIPEETIPEGHLPEHERSFFVYEEEPQASQSKQVYQPTLF